MWLNSICLLPSFQFQSNIVHRLNTRPAVVAAGLSEPITIEISEIFSLIEPHVAKIKVQEIVRCKCGGRTIKLQSISFYIVTII